MTFFPYSAALLAMIECGATGQWHDVPPNSSTIGIGPTVEAAWNAALNAASPDSCDTCEGTGCEKTPGGENFGTGTEATFGSNPSGTRKTCIIDWGTGAQVRSMCTNCEPE